MSAYAYEKKWDFIVVGSGPSGGRIAQELIASGAKVLLLEAGSHYSKKDFPKSEMEGSSQMYWGGGVELNHDARLGFLRAKCVGGTSIVNQALLDRFDHYAWDEWSEISGLKFSEAEYQPIYEAIEKSLSIETIPEKHFGNNTKLFIKAFEKHNLGWAALRRGQSSCDIDHGNDCMSCLAGCGRNSKQSSLVTSVEPAMLKGLEVQADCEVEKVVEANGEVTIFAKIKNKQTRTSSSVQFKAGAVVLAAGSFGTTKIMLQSDFKNKLPFLGKGISCHPQYMSFSLFDKPVDSFKGAFQAVKSYDKKLRESGFKFENVFAPPIATAMLLDGFGKKHQDQMKKYRYLASMEVAIRDESSGEMFIKNGRMVVNKSLTERDKSRMAEGQKLIVEMFQSVEAKEIIKCEQAFGLHLMGGCAIGADKKKSVVSSEFNVHDTKKIFIADSSIFPSAPGINPSLTVMALSHKAVPYIMKGAS